MKERIVCVIAAALLLFAAGCAKREAVNADAGAVADEIVKSVTFRDQMSPIAQKTIVKNYGLDAADVTKAKAYESTGATAEEAAVFEAKDEAAAERVKKAAQGRVEDQKSAFQDYQPKEMAKLKNPLLIQSGRYVVLVVADDTSGAKKITDRYLR
ncbi:MAG: DUF4358 domain-containing protein [Oscillospiraceae bacterium]|jgi:hypothetical protein|nr:DUF4358 domain-containing protein [Oscillospiraceae bacterium]MCI1989756.1 DUF4358 domain-containing protein [Oscillospiraceae bacterium]MCI2034359.1 DUF4358 domain-containing protein [Oscillospiraceae bacterium]